MGYIDTHAHIYDESYLLEFDELIHRAISQNVTRIVMIICDIHIAKQALHTARKYEMVDVAIGIHPESVDDVVEEDYIVLKEVLKDPKVIAVGEIGLDYYWTIDNKEKQKEVFLRQMEIANEYNLPILIHCRDSYQDMYDILKNHDVGRKGIMHCYSGSVEMAKLYLELGYYISLAGPVTFKNAKTPKEVAKAIPLNRLFIETDSPYLTPVPYRGKRNEPSYVYYVGQQIMELKGLKEDEFLCQLCENYEKVFQIKI